MGRLGGAPSSLTGAGTKASRRAADSREVITRTRILVVAACLLLVGSGLWASALEEQGDWDLAVFGLLLVLVICADLQDIDFRQVSISVNFLALVLAMALLVPAPAAVLGVLSNF